MKTALLDVNLLIALFWPDHQHHERAVWWFHSRRSGRWATCPLTQLAFVRILSNPAFSPEALSPTQAVNVIATNIKHSRHDFWPDSLDVRSALNAFEGRIEGHKQFTDAYLLALAANRHGKLATFDRGLVDLAGSPLSGAIEIVSTA